MGNNVFNECYGDVNAVLQTMKDLYYKEMMLMSVSFLMELNAFFYIIFIRHPAIYYFSPTTLFEIGYTLKLVNDG